MITRLCFCISLFLAPGLALGEADPVIAAQEASDSLNRAASLLSDASRARDKVTALTETVRAYEDGLEALREGMRRAALRERAIRTEFEHKEEQLSALLGALSSMQTSPESLVLLHPEGPLSSARAGIMLADVTPGIDDRVRTLRSELEELVLLRALQDAASDTLREGLDGVQSARTALSKAISQRSGSPDASATDIATMQAIVNSADTLQGFAASLATLGPSDVADSIDFVGRRGTLSLPASGAILARYEEADATGTRRPGLLLATSPMALVTAPHAATVRFAGPLLDLGLVAILEPEAGYLLILAGLSEAFVSQGEVLEGGAPVGLMGGPAPQAEQILIETGEGGGQDRAETLYIELRKGDMTLDPANWFELAEG